MNKLKATESIDTPTRKSRRLSDIQEEKNLIKDKNIDDNSNQSKSDSADPSTRSQSPMKQKKEKKETEPEQAPEKEKITQVF